MLFAALFEFINATINYIFPPSGVSNIESFRKNTPIIGALWWGVVFRGPSYVLWGTVPLLLSFLCLELFRLRSMALVLGVWAAAGFLATTIGSRGIVVPIAAVSAGGTVGAIYWFLAGRFSDGWLPPSKPATRTAYIMDIAAYTLLGLVVLQLIGYPYYAAKWIWVSYIYEPARGTPPFQTGNKLKMSGAQKVALLDFPDAAACLKEGLEKPASENLENMDWDKISNKAEAEVCIFRLLGSYDDISYATAWLEAQGFQVPERWSSASPYKELNGDLRVTGNWSIKKKGPKFPTGGLFSRKLYSISYSMHVNATWSKDGRQLKRVRVGFNTL